MHSLLSSIKGTRRDTANVGGSPTKTRHVEQMGSGRGSRARRVRYEHHFHPFQRHSSQSFSRQRRTVKLTIIHEEAGQRCASRASPNDQAVCFDVAIWNRNIP
jgi:hypothetical protein